MDPVLINSISIIMVAITTIIQGMHIKRLENRIK